MSATLKKVWVFQQQQDSIMSQKTVEDKRLRNMKNHKLILLTAVLKGNRDISM